MRASPLAVLLVLACATPVPRPSTPLASAATSERAAPSASAAGQPADPRVEAAPVAPPPEEVEPVEPEVPRVTFAIPEGRPPALTRLPVRRVVVRHVAWDEVVHPDPVARRRLGQLLEELAFQWGALANGWDDEAAQTGCRVEMATERIVSVVCRPRQPSDRTGSADPPPGVELPIVTHFVIDGHEVRPFALEEALPDGRRFGDLVEVPRCVAAARGRRDRRGPAGWCRDVLARAPAVLTPQGVGVLLDYGRSVVVPFASLREQVREDGPIAWLFAGVDRPPAPSPEEADGWALGEVAPRSELAAGMASWPPIAREALRIVALDAGAGQWAVPRSVGYARARAIAEALGVTARRARWTALLRPALSRLARDAPLAYVEQDWAPRRILPGGTLVTALIPENADGATRVEVVAAPQMTGVVQADALRSHDGCAPDPAAFLAALAEADRVEASDRLASVLVTLPGSRDATLFVTRVGGRTFSRLALRGPACEEGETLFAAETPGFVIDARIGSTEPDGGVPVLVLRLGTAAGGHRFVVYHVPSGRRALSLELEREEVVGTDTGLEIRHVEFHPRPQHGPAAEVPWALSLFDGASYVWEGTRLVEREPPAE